MADLMKSVQTKFVTLKKGDAVTGVVTKLTSSEILLDINAKTEAVVLEKDRRLMHLLLSLLKVGDSVTASVLNPESDMGNPVVSLRRFLDEKTWGKLEKLQKSQEPVDIVIGEMTRGGYTAATKDGFSGFLPNSHVSLSTAGENLVGKTVKAMIFELDHSQHKIIFSQKITMSTADFEKAAKELKFGQKISATVANVASFGVFLNIQISQDLSLEGFVHISEVSWDKVDDLSVLFSAGDKIEGVVIGFDKEARRVNVSIKRLTADPFDQISKEFSIDKKVTGTVEKVLSTGVVVTLGENIEGFIKKDKIPPTVTFKAGDSVTVTVSEIDKKKHRIVLTPVLQAKPIGYR